MSMSQRVRAGLACFAAAGALMLGSTSLTTSPSAAAASRIQTLDPYPSCSKWLDKVDGKTMADTPTKVNASKSTCTPQGQPFTFQAQAKCRIKPMVKSLERTYWAYGERVTAGDTSVAACHDGGVVTYSLTRVFAPTP